MQIITKNILFFAFHILFFQNRTTYQSDLNLQYTGCVFSGTVSLLIVLLPIPTLYVLGCPYIINEMHFIYVKYLENYSLIGCSGKNHKIRILFIGIDENSKM